VDVRGVVVHLGGPLSEFRSLSHVFLCDVDLVLIQFTKIRNIDREDRSFYHDAPRRQCCGSCQGAVPDVEVGLRTEYAPLNRATPRHSLPFGDPIHAWVTIRLH
jgi:hypothetical protein